MVDWIERSAQQIAERAERELEALVAVSTPSGDNDAAEEAVAVVTALAPDRAAIERVPCSSPGHAPDLILRITGTGTKRILLLGHLDTVVAHADHRRVSTDPAHPDRLVGSGTVDMKGGDILALGVLRALAAERTADLAEVALLLVNDEEWRTTPFGHAERFAGFDACLCFEAGELTDDGDDAVVVRRKAAGAVVVDAVGRSAHSGAAPEKGRNALLALAHIAQLIGEANDPTGPDRLTAVPTILRSGEALNVVPGAGQLTADLRADRLEAIEAVVDWLPAELDEVRIDARMGRRWPGMDAREATAPLLAAASEALGRPIVAAQRGGASDASHFAATIALTVDGLGPRGGGAHATHEYVDRRSLLPRAQVALALAHAALIGS
jgi:glutamate carboxypeptidase